MCDCFNKNLFCNFFTMSLFWYYGVSSYVPHMYSRHYRDLWRKFNMSLYLIKNDNFGSSRIQWSDSTVISPFFCHDILSSCQDIMIRRYWYLSQYIDVEIFRESWISSRWTESNVFLVLFWEMFYNSSELKVRYSVVRQFDS
jgi:hypothetical protein